MPYNTSAKVVDKWKDALDSLLPGQQIEFTTSNPGKLAYHLREAIVAARHNKIEPYASLEFTFRAESARVVCIPKESLAVPVARKSHATITNVETHYEVITATKENPAPVLAFPNFIGDINPVKKWATAKGYEVVEEPVLTLIRQDKDGI